MASRAFKTDKLSRKGGRQKRFNSDKIGNSDEICERVCNVTPEIITRISNAHFFSTQFDIRVSVRAKCEDFRIQRKFFRAARPLCETDISAMILVIFILYFYMWNYHVVNLELRIVYFHLWKFILFITYSRYFRKAKENYMYSETDVMKNM